MKKVLTIGSATQDIFIRYPNPQALQQGEGLARCYYLLVAEGCKIEVEDITYTTGGGSTNSAVSFKKLGLEVASFFQTGNDLQAEQVRKCLAQEGINLEHTISTSGHRTGRSFILPSPTGNQPILAYRGANAFVNSCDLPLGVLAQFDFVYVTSLSGKSSDCLLPLAQQAHKQGIPVATNPGTSQLAAGAEKLRTALPYIEILLLNAHEARQLMHSFAHEGKKTKHWQQQAGAERYEDEAPKLLAQPLIYKELTFTLNDFFNEVHAHGPRLAVVTNGVEGVYLSDGQSILFQKSVPAHVVSTVGAGDAFGSCFVASVMQGLPHKEALKRGVVNAASVIGHLGAKEGLLGADAFV